MPALPGVRQTATPDYLPPYQMKNYHPSFNLTNCDLCVCPNCSLPYTIPSHPPHLFVASQHSFRRTFCTHWATRQNRWMIWKGMGGVVLSASLPFPPQGRALARKRHAHFPFLKGALCFGGGGSRRHPLPPPPYLPTYPFDNGYTEQKRQDFPLRSTSGREEGRQAGTPPKCFNIPTKDMGYACITSVW